MKYKIIIILLLIVTITCKADTLNVPLQFSSIQLALDTSESNDVIMVQPGIYFENLVWPSINNIHLISAGDTSNTFIDGGNYGRVITMNSYLVVIDTSTTIKGFTIQNGFVLDSLNSRGAGLYIYNCSPKLFNLRIRNNKSQSFAAYGVGKFTSEEKIRIVLEGLRAEESIASICRREGINPNLYYRWSKSFLEAGKKGRCSTK